MPDREKAIQELDDSLKNQHCGFVDGVGDVYAVSEETIKNIITMLKEQETGHWIVLNDCSNSGVYCSECSTKVFEQYPFKKKLSYFCPHCGTRMESEKQL